MMGLLPSSHRLAPASLLGTQFPTVEGVSNRNLNQA